MRKFLAILICILMIFAGPLIVAPEASKECKAPNIIDIYVFSDGGVVWSVDMDCDCVADGAVTVDPRTGTPVVFNEYGLKLFKEFVAKVQAGEVPNVKVQIHKDPNSVCKNAPTPKKNNWRPNNWDSWSCYNN